MERSMLVVFAHPDDEAFATGGTLAKYASAGVRTTLVCATRGEVGEISDPVLATPNTLPSVREQELLCSAETLGIEEVVFLGYRDSGMIGTPDNEHPDAFILANEEEVIARLVGIMRQVKPQIVLTFEPNGGYGHPDHIAIHNHTVSAFHKAAQEDYGVELGGAWRSDRLIYTAIPKSFFVDMRSRLQGLGEDTSDLDRFDETGFVWPDDQVDVEVDVSDVVDRKWSALQCHQTQFGPDNLFRRLPDEDAKALMSREYFAIAWPEISREEPGSDLFA
ncbi:MAG: PIG-L family deacetylase [Anaerolineales bacterium]|jgi:LmbE family N-acetylglucosaminyl deacetylase